jgi:D-alanine-D-alanine ligase
MKKIKTIAIVCNLKPGSAKGDEFEEYDEMRTIDALRSEIEKLGFTVIVIEQKDLCVRLNRETPDFVFNIAEGTGTSRGRESQVPCLLESRGIPYSGSDPVSLALTLDKYLSSQFLRAAGVAVPDMYLVRDNRECDALKDIFKRHRRLIVKPRWEGSSKGIFLSSVVDTFTQLKEQVVGVLEKYKQPAVIEEFLEKSEITVCVCGNGHPALLGMMEIGYTKKQQGTFIYSQEVKRAWQEKVAYRPQDSIPKMIRSRIETAALEIFSVLELRDIARIDFRLGCDDIPRVIDINPLPGLSPHYSDLPILCRLNGISYSELIATILSAAFTRLGFEPFTVTCRL